MKKERDNAKTLEAVSRIRAVHPSAGIRKLVKYLQNGEYYENMYVGRDYLFHLLKKKGMLVKRPKKAPKTTNSNHGYDIAPNILAKTELTHPYQAAVADITYISYAGGYLYLSLITDAYTREILGYCLHDNLKTEGCLKAQKNGGSQHSVWFKTNPSQ